MLTRSWMSGFSDELMLKMPAKSHQVKLRILIQKVIIHWASCSSLISHPATSGCESSRMHRDDRATGTSQRLLSRMALLDLRGLQDKSTLGCVCWSW
jgi:hypothetical protein